MEENENNEVKNVEVESNSTVTDSNESTTNNNNNNVVETLKSKKNLVIGIIIAIIVVLFVYNIFFNTKGKAKDVVKRYYSAFNKGKVKKMVKTVDPAGAYVFSKLDEDEYEDFWDEYKEFVDSDEYSDYMDNYKENQDEGMEEMEDYLDDLDYSIKVKKIKEVKKVSSHLYKVKLQLETKEDDDKSQETVTHYVMKKGLKCYLVDASL